MRRLPSLLNEYFTVRLHIYLVCIRLSFIAVHAAMGNPGYSTAQVEEALCRWIDSKHPLARYEINLVTRLIGIDMSDANSSEFSTGKETRPKHRRSGTILSRNKDGYDIRPLQCLSTLRLCDDENGTGNALKLCDRHQTDELVVRYISHVSGRGEPTKNVGLHTKPACSCVHGRSSD